jgi:putative phosphoesterase
LTKIGIISDTHDDIVNVRKALEIFRNYKIKYVIHAGDYIFPGIVKEFGKLKEATFIGVFGNNEGEKLGLSKSFKEIDGEL